MSDATTGGSSESRHLARLSGFQIKTIMLALLLTLGGAGGMIWQRMDQKIDRSPQTSVPETARSIVHDPAAENPELQSTEPETWTQWLSTKGVKLGLSFMGGFAIGFVFRTFLKTMAILTALSATAIVLLSYFQVFNIDFSHVEQTWHTHSEWIATQATKLKDFLWTYLPSSTAGLIGFFVGMLRR